MRASLLAPLLAAASLTVCAACASERPPNIVLVVLDTVRADRLSCHGYERPTTPRLDELCARGIRFDAASSTSSWTLPAHASMFTGLYPIEHRANQEHTRLDEGPPTLAEILRENGYATYAVSANPVVSIHNGFGRGFERYAETWRARRPSDTARSTGHPNLAAVDRFLGGSPRPFFLFVNFIEAHAPYRPPEPYASKFLTNPDPSLVRAAQSRSTRSLYLERPSIPAAEIAVMNDLYDGEIAYLDALLDELMTVLERHASLDDSVVIITSDHGENLGDHDHYRHVFSLYATTVHVPLIVLLPRRARAGEVRKESVSLIDLFPTILSLAALNPPNGPGRDLLSADGGGVRPIFAEYDFPLQVLEQFGPDALARRRQSLAPYLRRLRSVELGGMRLIWSSSGRSELFDRARDPGEQNDVAGEVSVAERESALHALLDDFVKQGGGDRPLPLLELPARGFQDMDPETAEQLRELGYLR